jgi:hypothetical protein
MTPIVAIYAQAAPEEVEIRGKRNEVGETSLSGPEVREVPGAFGDAFRAVEVMPGVAPIVSGLPYFYMRGAPPNNNGYFLDGVRVPLLFHVGIAQAVVHPGLVDRVDFYPGAPPARYGGFAGGIVAGETKAPAAAFHGEANLRLIDAGTLVEMPFADGRGTALVAGRFGYPGLVVSLLSPDTKLQYSDYQARTTYRLTDKDQIGVFAFGSHDVLATRTNGGGGEPKRLIEQLASDFHRVDARWDHAITDGQMRVAGTFGYDHQGATPTYLTDVSGRVRLEVDKRLSENVRIRGGGSAAVDNYGFDEEGPITRDSPLVPSPATARTNISADAWSDVVWHVAPRVELVPGARVDWCTKVAAVDPRLSARITLSPRVTYVATAGLSHQYEALRVGQVPTEAVTEPGFTNGSRRVQEVAQASHGFEVHLPAEITASVTGFMAGWTALTDVTDTCHERMEAFTQHPDLPNPPPPTIDCPSNDPVHAHAYGVELLARRSLTKRVTGWVSYTLSRSTREAHINNDVVTVPSEGDHTHVLNVVGAYDLGRRWRAGGRFVYFSGAPYSPTSGSIPVPPYNSLRYDPFFRVDVRVEKRWSFLKDGSIAFVAEVQNITLSKQEFGSDCQGIGMADPKTGLYTETNKCKPGRLGPLTIPSVGVEAFF